MLLVNPPIYDFSAYDFWLKPYGLLRAGAILRNHIDLQLYDYMDRQHPDFPSEIAAKTNVWGCGPYPKERLQKPTVFKQIPRLYNRFGMAREHFQSFMATLDRLDGVLIQTSLTYWYPGVREVIEDVRRFHPSATVVLGGFYATCCSAHARSLGADIVIQGDELEPMFRHFHLRRPVEPDLPAWELYPSLKTGVIKLTQGCPFGCSYCYLPQSGVKFAVRGVEDCLEELAYLVRCGAENVAFYDDALLYQPEKVLFPFFEGVLRRGLKVNFHTPNALHARFLSAKAAQIMVQAGVKTFFLGFESRSEDFHGKAGAKVVSDELATAVRNLREAGADLNEVTAYEMLGHPRFEAQQLEGSMRFASDLGIRVMLSDFSPIPGTPDGELCRGIVDLDEPLCHNKTAFPILSLGTETVGAYKDLCRALNRRHRHNTATPDDSINAFTLIEILVVLAIIALLLGIVIPCLHNVKRSAAAGVCLSNISQLGKSWLLYANDSNGYFVDGDTSDELGKDAGFSYYDRAQWGERDGMRVHNWVGRPMGPNGEDQNDTLDDKIRGFEAGALWSYIQNHKLYNCPADKRFTKTATRPLNNLAEPPGEWFGGFRSYSIGKPLSRRVTEPSDPWGEIAAEIQKMTQFVNPSTKVVFIEETDGYGWNHRTWDINLRQPQWIDPFAILHNGNSTLVFCDGHADQRKWVDMQTRNMAKQQAKGWMAIDPTTGSTEDYEWFRKAFIPGREPIF
jgi:prepilin-type N-terminal cleavage/methylation domain-containing protein